MEKEDPELLKQTKGKPDFTLIPTRAMKGVVEVRQFGVEKYPASGRDGWVKVNDAKKTFLAAAYRHLIAMIENGIDSVADDSQLMHVDHCACNLLFISELIRKERENK
jgi:hypothetical protein